MILLLLFFTSCRHFSVVEGARGEYPSRKNQVVERLSPLVVGLHTP